MAITWASDVVAIAPELASVVTATQNKILAFVDLQFNTTLWGDKLDMGKTYLAAHLGTLSRRAGAGGPVVSESVGQVSRSYAASIASGAAMLESTSYGLEYKRLLRQLPGARFTVA